MVEGLRLACRDPALEGIDPEQITYYFRRVMVIPRGKVVFRSDESAPPFDLHTPNSTLVDFGTEYAVAVGPQGEEVHVFDGEVRRTPNVGT